MIWQNVKKNYIKMIDFKKFVKKLKSNYMKILDFKKFVKVSKYNCT